MQRWVVACALAFLLCAAVAAEDCPDGGQCEDGPTDQAQCCGEPVHCCPAGMTCDEGKSQCVNTTHSVPWTERTSAESSKLSRSYRMIKSYSGEEDDNICPDQSRCPAEYSCLRALTKYGCCPLAQGIPCSDGKHCCPQGHSCSEDSRSCLKKDVTSTVLCSDGVSECPDESSCCEGADGEFSCCPVPQAVCCNDKVHCCPEGTLCDLEASKCISASLKKQLPMWAKFPARKRAEWEDQKEDQHVTSEAATGSENEEGKVDNVKTVAGPGEQVSKVKCNATAYCMDGTTCCKTVQGQWACCPLPNAVCCDDHVHCCPQGTRCDTSKLTCESSSDSQTTPMSQKTPAFITDAEVETQVSESDLSEQTESEEEEEEDEDIEGRVRCKGHKNLTCHFDGTCCGRLCCPLPNATCCRGKHCCPHGYTCQNKNHSCIKDGVKIPWYMELPALPSPEPEVPDSVVRPDERASDVKCDDFFSCPDETTCCSDGQGSWGCCPSPNAVYCTDHRHCCPHGTTCDLEHQKCQNTSDSQTTPLIPKIPAFTTATPSTTGEMQVVGKVQSEAETEEDEEEGDEEEEDDGDDQSLDCKDDKHSPCSKKNATTRCCSSGCHKCKCCPKPNAKCCRDHKHCCPHGFKCRPKHHTCVKKEKGKREEIPWLEMTQEADSPEPVDVEIQENEPDQKEPESEEKKKTADDDDDDSDDDDDDGDDDTDGGGDDEDYDEDEEALTRCDDQTACPKGSTCCNCGDRWGCCPLADAVCCSDGAHCCPHHYKCSKSRNACVRDDDVVIPWYPKLPALSNLKRASDNDVDCPDGHRCPEHSTCCQLTSGEYGCCPLERAVCCPDKMHCCPEGYTCDSTGQGCEMSVVLEVDFIPLTPAKSEPKKCGPLICTDTEKCCMNRGMPHCCKFKDGVCCNERYCCPSGQHCDRAKRCISNSGSFWDKWSSLFQKIEEYPVAL